MLLLAGELSGDEHAAALARELRLRLPKLRMRGIGGPGMAAAGVELLADLDDLAVMGFSEIVPRLEFFRTLEQRITELLYDDTLDLVIPVDYPGFNLRIARAATERSRRVLYFIPPKAWAWRAGRARKLAERTDRVAVILPFEADFFSAAGSDARFVGNPLLDRPDDVPGVVEFHDRFDLDPNRPILAVLPGSRRQEIQRHLAPFRGAVERVLDARPDVQPVVGRAATLPEELFSDFGVPVVDDSRALLRHATAGLVKSGTSTLEAALEGTPMVVPYITSAFSWAIVKRVLRTKYVALPNLVAEREVVPELIQDRATEQGIAAALLPLLDRESEEARRQRRDLREVCERLGEPGATRRVADMALELMGIPA